MNTETRRDGTVQLADWWEDLLWPRVMAAAALGVRRARIGLAFFRMVVVLIVAGVGQEVDGWLGKTGMPLPWEVGHGRGGDGPHTMLWRLIVTYPVACMTSMPFTTSLLVLVALPVWLVVMGAISRMAAVEFAKGEFVPWTEALGFSLRRVVSLVGAVVGPLIAVWLIALVLAVGGFLLLNWPYVNVVGGALYVFALVLGIVAALIGLVYIAGKSLLVPAVTCDGADAIDAIQRAYAYTLDRPVRLVLYIALSAIGFGVVVLIVGSILGAGIGVAYAGTGWWLGEKGRQMLEYGTISAVPGLGGFVPKPEGSYEAGAWMIRLWTMIPVFGFIACLASSCVACSTIVYLAMRRVCDGQDTSELWVPGEIEGAMKASLAGRAAQVGAVGSAASEAAGEES